MSFLFLFFYSGGPLVDPHCAGSKKNILLNHVLNLNLPTSMVTRKLK